MCDRGGATLLLFEKTFENLKHQRARLVDVWSHHLSEHIHSLSTE